MAPAASDAMLDQLQRQHRRQLEILNALVLALQRRAQS